MQSQPHVCMATTRVSLRSRSLPAPWSTVGEPLLEAMSYDCISSRTPAWIYL
jgi:hypothetical protein